MFVADSLVVIGMAVVSLGTIQEADGAKEHTFWLRNAGQQAVTITQGYTSCGCTTIHYDKAKTIAPGDSSKVTLRFNPRGKGGEFYESGTIEYGQKRKRLQLALKGECVTSEETLLKQFPIQVSKDVRLSANRFDLGYMSAGDSKERHVTILYMGKKNKKETRVIHFTVDAKLPKGLQHIAYPLKIGKQQTTITLDVFIR